MTCSAARPPTPVSHGELSARLWCSGGRSKALVAVVSEYYVRGVSTRRVDGLVKTLGVESLSKSSIGPRSPLLR